MSENLLDVDVLCEQRHQELRAAVTDPDTDPVILALERDEAYDLARHHEELRALAEEAERHQIQRTRLMTPKALAFTTMEELLVKYVSASLGASDWAQQHELAEDLLVICRRANVETQSVINEIKKGSGEPTQVLLAQDALAEDLLTEAVADR